VDEAGFPRWPEDVIAAQQAVRERQRALARELGLPEDAPDVGTHRINTPARQSLRVAIGEALLNERARAVGTVRQDRRGFIVMGPPAAGKSTVIEPLARREGALVIDADDIKARLPEFDNGLGAAVVHEESALIAERMLNDAIRAGANVALPVVGKTLSTLRERIAMLKGAGYQVSLILVDLPIDKAADRAIARFRKTGRFVDPDCGGGRRPARARIRSVERRSGWIRTIRNRRPRRTTPDQS
jgi:predicted ABC-type ATPase